MRRLKINAELLNIFKDVRSKGKSLNEWKEIESCDMFQTQSFCGGFDATENQFTFSYFANDSTEFWFQFSLSELDHFLNGKLTEVELRQADQ